MPLGDRVSRYIVDHAKSVLAVITVITLGAVFLLPTIKLDNSVDAFFNEKSRNYASFQEWKKQFGSDTVVVVAFSDKDIFTRENLSLIDDISRQFETVRFVHKVTSLATVNDIVGSEEDFVVERLVKAIPDDAAGLAVLKKRALENPLYTKNVVSSDGRTAAVIVELDHDVQARADAEGFKKKEAVAAIHAILEKTFPKGKKFFVSGPAAIEYFYVKYIQDDLRHFMPLMMLVVMVVLFISFRSMAGIILPMSVTSITLVWTMAYLALCKFAINSVTTTLPPIMLSITLLETIHFLWEIKEQKKHHADSADTREIIVSTMRHLFIPCVLTNVTTVIGFFSLLISTVPPLRQLGLVAGVGVFFSLIIAFTFLPAAIQVFNMVPRITAESRSLKQSALHMENLVTVLLTRVIVLCQKYTCFILSLAVLLTGACVWYTFQIKTETSILEFFKKSSPIYKATNYIEEHLSGVHFLNISIKAKQGDYFKDPRVLADIERLQSYLKTIPQVDKTTSVLDYLKEVNKSFYNEDPRKYAIPESKNLVSQYVLLYGADDLNDFVDEQWQWTTLRIRLKEHSTHKLKKVIDEIESFLKKNMSAVTAEVVGQTVLEVDANEAVTSGQVQSLGLAMLLIFGIMFIDFRSFSVGIVSILPNILPLLMNFGVMGLFGIRLDSATAMISDIGIGIIVDDTIHFLHTAGNVAKKTGDYAKAMSTALLTKGTPTFITTLILMLGFGVVSFSQFVPTFYFGSLSAFLMLSGLVIELFLLPALLLAVKPKFA